MISSDRVQDVFYYEVTERKISNYLPELTSYLEKRSLIIC